jgi:tetratricopeptide (TPR) repeat protein
LIVLATVAAYHPALHGGPLWDDFGHITFPELRSLGGLWRIWSELGATQQYYPLLHSAFWLEHRLWGDAVLGYHFINVAQHSLSAFLVVLILRRLAVPGALLAGLVFALHPVAVESVAWISEQKNTLSAVFYLASTYVYLRDPRDPRDPRDLRSRYYWLSFVLFVCALLTKTVTATLPAALLVVLWWQHGRLDWRRDVQPLVPWFVAAAIAGAFTAWFEWEIIGARGADFDLTIIERCLLAGRVIWFYLAKLFWPQNLTFIYPRWEIDANVWWQYLFSAGAIALAGGLAILAKRHRGPLAGYLYFCGTLVPVLGFFDVYPFRFSYVADHFQYLASLGVIVPVASALTIALARITPDRNRIAAVVAAALVTALGVTTWRHSAVYRDAETLYRDTIARNPHAWMAYQNLGTELGARNRFAEAIEAYEGALRVRPDYVEAKRNLALAHMKLGDAAAESPERANEAIAHYEAVLRIEPNHFRARYNAGTLLMDVPGRQADSIGHLESAVQIQPDGAEARVNLGVLLADVPGREAEAVEHLEFALAQRPDLVRLRELVEEIKKRP